jgi:hypothetical protein
LDCSTTFHSDDVVVVVFLISTIAVVVVVVVEFESNNVPIFGVHSLAAAFSIEMVKSRSQNEKPNNETYLANNKSSFSGTMSVGELRVHTK